MLAAMESIESRYYINYISTIFPGKTLTLFHYSEQKQNLSGERKKKQNICESVFFRYHDAECRVSFFFKINLTPRSIHRHRRRCCRLNHCLVRFPISHSDKFIALIGVSLSNARKRSYRCDTVNKGDFGNRNQAMCRWKKLTLLILTLID